MKLPALLAIASFAVGLAGCAGTSKGDWPLDSETISSALDAKIVDCALPFLVAHDIEKATVHYRYQQGKTTFTSNEAALSAHIAQCAATTSGPNITFEKEIELWTSNEQ